VAKDISRTILTEQRSRRLKTHNIRCCLFRKVELAHWRPTEKNPKRINMRYCHFQVVVARCEDGDSTRLWNVGLVQRTTRRCIPDSSHLHTVSVFTNSTVHRSRVNPCPQITSWSLRGVNVLSAVRGEYRACRWTEDFLLVSDKDA
jgi:hypothetical protein